MAEKKSDSDTIKSTEKATPLGRRDFVKLGTLGALAAELLGSKALAGTRPPGRDDEVIAGSVAIHLRINGQDRKLELEPRVTLLDALRDRLDLTGSKKVCDRGACGACTVLVDGKAAYACSVLAIEAQGREITTIEGLGTPDALHPLQAAFVENDALQCGFCTPGFVMASAAFLAGHPSPTAAEIRHGLGGNLCRCGAYAGIRTAVADVADRTAPQEVSRLDAPAKVTGRARYSHDINRRGMLFAKLVRCPHAHARVVSVDTAAAEKMKGVAAVRVIQGPGSEIRWALDEVAVVAAVSDEIAADAAAAVRIDYEILPHLVSEKRLAGAAQVQTAEEQVSGDPAAAMAAAEARIAGTYGLPSVAHCCPEPHGQVCEWRGRDSLTAWCSTQNVSGLPSRLAEKLGVPASGVRVLTEHMGGGFGSKLGADRWDTECAELSRQTGAPVKLMLERDAELTVAGHRPSAYARVRVGTKNDGTVTAWESRSWGSAGKDSSAGPPLPYVFQVADRKHQHSVVLTHTAASRCWRAPDHPQACFITMAALEDAAARLGMDPVDFFLKNIDLAGPLAGTYRQEIAIAARLMGWRQRWQPRSRLRQGAIQQGLGLSLHTWRGRSQQSNCEVVIHPDGGVEARLASQDLGTGTRTVIAVVLAEILGLSPESVTVRIGDSRLPVSGASTGSSTAAAVSAATRRAAVAARQQLFDRVAPALGVAPEQIEARGGRVQVKNNPETGMSWSAAAATIGGRPLTATGSSPGGTSTPGATSEGEAADNAAGFRSGDLGTLVGGVQMAAVQVDMETGVVKLKRMVAVQDCGLIIDRKLAESQVLGGLIMGIGSALCEERIIDPVTGLMLNADMEFYKLAGLGDVGELTVHLMTGPGYDERGVIGVGEAPVISPGAAIANAVANAIGVRVPELPLTPDRVIAAVEAGGVLG